MTPLQNAARTALESCLALRPGESLLVITDEPLRRIAYAFWEEGRILGAESMLMEMETWITRTILQRVRSLL